MKPWGFFLVLVVFGALASLGLFFFGGPERSPSEKPVMVVSAYPIFYFAENIGGDEIRVDTITPLGVEPHDYEPTVGERVRLERADAFVFVCGGVGPWAGKFVRSYEGTGMNIRSLLPSGENIPAIIPKEETLRAS